MNIVRISVHTRPHGTDKVYVFTDLPSPFPLYVDPQDLSMSFDVRRGCGVEYVRKHFPDVPLKIIDEQT